MQRAVAKIDGSPLDFSGLYDVEVWIGAIFAVVVFLVPLVLTGRSILRQMRSSHYAELDRIYMDILKTAIDNPYLRDRELIPHYVQYLRSQNTWLKARGLAGDPPAWDDAIAAQRREQALKYDSYAFIVFNFLETIHDRCDDNRRWDGRPDGKLRTTWEGVIGDEVRLHSAWFDMETIPVAKTRSAKFCVEFAQFMWDRGWENERWSYRSPQQIRRLHPEKFADARPARAEFGTVAITPAQAEPLPAGGPKERRI